MLNYFKKHTFDYEIQGISPTDYELELSVVVEGKLMQNLFTKAKLKLARSKGIHTDGSLEHIDSFDLSQDYFKIMAIALKRILIRIIEQQKDKGRELLDYKVTKGRYEKIGDKWQIRILLKGTYAIKGLTSGLQI